MRALATSKFNHHSVLYVELKIVQKFQLVQKCCSPYVELGPIEQTVSVPFLTAAVAPTLSLFPFQGSGYDYKTLYRQGMGYPSSPPFICMATKIIWGGCFLGSITRKAWLGGDHIEGFLHWGISAVESALQGSLLNTFRRCMKTDVQKWLLMSTNFFSSLFFFLPFPYNLFLYPFLHPN